MHEGDEVVMMEHLSHASIHTQQEGAEGFLISQRIVPVREEPGKVVVRTLRYGEEDDGRRCHVKPGDEVVLQPEVQLDYVDEWESQGVDGYVPLTPVLFTWMSLGTHHSDDKRRYLLAAARRLDQAQTLFQRIEQLRQSDPEGAPATRRAIFELVGATELAVVALSRALDMCIKARSKIGAASRVPREISRKCDPLRAIRNSYEHIEDRAVGLGTKGPDADALTIFKHDRVVVDGVVEYGKYQLELTAEVPELIRLARQFLKDAAGES
ncbi:light-mediated development protein DET1 [Rhodococcus sp. NPDC060086]|uniref:light-mediated development protein DET1 n=1 Tax=Rhodococcus sp. NPDC060086 TaxID=3347055 RepID=UPI00364F4EBF